MGQTNKKTVEGWGEGQRTEFARELERLESQLAGGRHDEGTGAVRGTRLQLLEERDEETRRLAAARARHRHHVLVLQDQRDALQSRPGREKKTTVSASVGLSLDLCGCKLLILHDSERREVFKHFIRQPKGNYFEQKVMSNVQFFSGFC